MFKNLILVFSILLCCQFTAEASVLKTTPVKRDSLYKNLDPRKLERNTSIQGLTIVVPDEQSWKDLGEQIANTVKDKWRLSIVVRVADPNKFSTGWAGNALILGNLGNNKQMARLYGLRMSHADAIYPGKGGYQLLTIVNPFGLGGNTVSISASDIDGARLGVNRLIEIIKKEKNPVIPWLLEAKLPEATTRYFGGYNPSPKASEIAKYTGRAKKLLSNLIPLMDDEPSKNVLLSIRSQINRYGESYQLTGNAAYGEMYKQLLLGYSQFLNNYPVETHDQLTRRNMWKDGEVFFQIWTVLEASSLFTDDEHRQILSAMYLTCEANSDDPYLKRAKETAPRWNHEIFPAMSLVGSCDYFEKYFKMPEVLDWKEKGHRIFKGNTSYISLDEGSDYLVHVPMVAINYAMATGDLKYLNRSLRPSADLNSMMIDNLGTRSGGGDTYPFGMSSAYSWGHSQVMNAASWYFNDPIYNILLERTKTGPFPEQRTPDLDYPIHRYTVDNNQTKPFSAANYPKVQAQEIEAGIYSSPRITQKINVDQPDSFHKLAFRSGFGLDDSHLILDGFSTGTHGHEDGNAILNYSANGRLFLVDRDYIQKTPEYHSGVVIVKNGEQFIKPAFAKLEWVADVEGTSISRSKISDYNDTDWNRTIISPSGNFYIIYDDLKINKPGSFILKNLWQSLGTPQIHENTFRVEQKGVMMQVQSMTNADLRLKDIYNHFIKYWKTVYPYPYADHETVLTQVIEEKQYQAGDRAGFISILSSHKENTYAVQGMRINENTMEISDGELTWFAVKGELNNDILYSDGTFHLLGNNEFLASGVKHIKVGSKELRFSVPVFFKMNTLTGEWKTYSLLKDKVRYDTEGNPIRQGALDSGMLNWNKSLLQGLQRVIRGNNKIQNIPSKATPLESIRDWKKIATFNEQITSSAYGDLNNDGKDELLLAGIKGAVKAIDSDGKELWKFAAKGRINEISVHRVGNQPLIFIATENWYVQALSAEGKELWKHKFPDDIRHKEYKGNLLGITNVRLAYINGRDKEPSIMVGTQFRYLYELNLQGKIKNKSMFYYYGLEDMEFADFDGDGKDEGVIGLEYFAYSFIKGRKITNARIRQPGWNVVEVFDRDARKGLPSALIGSKEREIRLVQFNKDRMEDKWVKNVGGVVNAIRSGDFNNDGNEEILVGSEGFQFYVLNPDGDIVFRRSLGDRVLKINGLRYKGNASYLAATAGGKLFRFSDSGTQEQSSQFSNEISNILVLNNSSSPFIVLENGDIYRDELSK